MIEREITICNRAGIHARPAALIVQTAARFKSKIMLERAGSRINAKSIMGIITLGAGFGTVLKLITDGDDENEAASALATLFDKKFEEE
ncbi:MAG: HPr family phosphocarrier protein [Spirochaetes bacterium]|nr:HPr family phosphocarrier protein [Spirochaetota bacterium]